jgi:fructose-bisphosphate aldolase class II
MIDASKASFEENIALTSKVVDYARRIGGKNVTSHKYIAVEAELGRLAGIEDNVNVNVLDSSYTDPNQVKEFVSRTKIDSLAIAIGTSHGAFKFKGEPKLRFDILQKITDLVPDFPLVLHGASSVPLTYVEKINANGGNVLGAQGVPEEMLKQATKMGISKINIDSDIRMAFTAGVREFLTLNPAVFDPRSYLMHARNFVKDLVKNKIINVLGSNNKA